jgi:integrase
MESLRAYSERRHIAGSEKCGARHIRSIEKIRAARHDLSGKMVSRETHYIRLTYIADYVEWLAKQIFERSAKRADGEVLNQIKAMGRNLRLHRPQKSRSSCLRARRGLTEKGQHELLRLIVPGAKENPFDVTVQKRNQVIVLLLYHLGMRSGELLSLKVSDFDFQRNEVVIPRRHDDKDDPRFNQPVAKTLDRRVPLNSSLSTLVADYVLKDRHLLPKARKHEFMLVTHKSGPYAGMPLSSKGLAKVFTKIQKVGSEELSGITPHVLRHTANDRLSELMDAQSVSEAYEEKMRSYLMGWKEGSGTASTYTRRHVEAKAVEASLKLQERNVRDGESSE